MVKIFYDKIPDKLDLHVFNNYWGYFPVEIQSKITAYKKQEDASLALMGKTTLTESIKSHWLRVAHYIIYKIKK
jgi:hypothetical protein